MFSNDLLVLSSGTKIISFRETEKRMPAFLCIIPIVGAVFIPIPTAVVTYR